MSIKFPLQWAPYGSCFGGKRSLYLHPKPRVSGSMPSKSASEDNTVGSSTGRETAQIQRVALYAFVLNLGLAALKALMAIQSGSLAITASMIDSGTDSIASLALCAGLWLSVRKSRRFPLGLYKIENVISVVVALFIFLAGYEIATKVFSPAQAPPDISLTVLGLMAAATLMTFLFGQYALKVGKQTESPSLKAEGRHRQADVLASVVVLLSVTLSYFHIQFQIFGITIDQIAAALVLIFIGHAGWELLSDGMRVLLDASIDFQTLERVRGLIMEEPAVAKIDSLVGRNAGRFRFLQATVDLRTDDLNRAHQISERIKSRIYEQVPHVEGVYLHYEPQHRKHTRAAVPLADNTGRISAHFGESPYFAILRFRLMDHHLIKQEIVENPHQQVEKAKGIRVAEWLVNQQVDELLVKEEMRHKGPGYVFSNAGITVHTADVDTLDQAIDALKKRLSP